ncbi:MAG: histidinol-phosphatase [Anaerolineae bacterium]|nr:histidinol-phosphatase [Anaerolineae bacterium]
MPENLGSVLQFALDSAWQAGRITLRYYQMPLPVDRKSDDSPVTQADRETEQHLRRLIAEKYPQHGIIGEEFGEQEPDAEYTWVIDPIDGTKSFIHGVPFYAVLVALIRDRRPVIGVMHFPALNETLYAAVDQGAYWNGRRIAVSSVSDLREATFLSSEVPTSQGRDWSRPFQQLCNTTRLQRTWGDSYGYAMVASGRAEIMIDARMKVWDCAAPAVIIEEAGGKFTDWKGESTIWGGESVGTNVALHQQAIDSLGKSE